MEKIAVLADIHGNLAALHALLEDLERWSPDLVVVAGDTVNRGPDSGACLELMLRLAHERDWRLIRGNHERYVLSYERDRLRPEYAAGGPRYEISRTLAWTHAQVSGHLAAIAAMPESLMIDLGEARMAVYHASVRHDRDGTSVDSPDDELRQQIDPTATVFCVGHTHVPFTRRIDGALVVNVGSVGLPFDRDRRAAYARLTHGRAGWQAQIVRLPYDVALTERAFYESGMLDAVGAQGILMLREVATGRSLLFDFVPAYYERIIAGSITVEAAIADYLAHVDRDT